MSNIGDRIRKRREEIGMTQDDLAAMLGYKNRTSVTKIEKGEHNLTQSKIKLIADILNTTPSYIMGWDEEKKKTKGVRIPVLGSVPAGIPIEAVEDIIDYEEIDETMASQGQYFGLKIQGDSMFPVIQDGDVVIVRKQESADTGDTVIALIEGETTCKKLKITDDGIMLIPNNSMYMPMAYSKREIKKLPVRIIGKVVELRRKF